MRPKICSHCGTQLDHLAEHTRSCPSCRLPLEPLAGEFVLQQILARGQLNTLYLATYTGQDDLPAQCVIKVFHPAFLLREGVEERIRQDVSAFSRLSQENPSFVRIYGDLREDPVQGHFYVMEYLQGVSMQTWLAREPMPSLRESLRLFLRVCEAISQMHQQDCLHRDLKPENILLLEKEGEEPQIKLLDFGLAKPLAGTKGGDLTQGVLGSAAYLSPEQCLNQQVDARSDLYALGVMLYEILTQRWPFGEKQESAISFFTTLHAHVSLPPDPLFQAQEQNQYSEEIECVVMKALAKTPEDRFGSVEAFRDALLASPFSPDDEHPLRVWLLEPKEQESEAKETKADVNVENVEEKPSLEEPTTMTEQRLSLRPLSLSPRTQRNAFSAWLMSFLCLYTGTALWTLSPESSQVRAYLAAQSRDWLAPSSAPALLSSRLASQQVSPLSPSPRLSALPLPSKTPAHLTSPRSPETPSLQILPSALTPPKTQILSETANPSPVPTQATIEKKALERQSARRLLARKARIRRARQIKAKRLLLPIPSQHATGRKPTSKPMELSLPEIASKKPSSPLEKADAPRSLTKKPAQDALSETNKAATAKQETPEKPDAQTAPTPRILTTPHQASATQPCLHPVESTANKERSEAVDAGAIEPAKAPPPPSTPPSQNGQPAESSTKQTPPSTKTEPAKDPLLPLPSARLIERSPSQQEMQKSTPSKDTAQKTDAVGAKKPTTEAKAVERKTPQPSKEEETAQKPSQGLPVPTKASQYPKASEHLTTPTPRQLLGEATKKSDAVGSSSPQKTETISTQSSPQEELAKKTPLQPKESIAEKNAKPTPQDAPLQGKTLEAPHLLKEKGTAQKKTEETKALPSHQEALAKATTPAPPPAKQKSKDAEPSAASVVPSLLSPPLLRFIEKAREAKGQKRPKERAQLSPPSPQKPTDPLLAVAQMKNKKRSQENSPKDRFFLLHESYEAFLLGQSAKPEKQGKKKSYRLLFSQKSLSQEELLANKPPWQEMALPTQTQQTRLLLVERCVAYQSLYLNEGIEKAEQLLLANDCILTHAPTALSEATGNEAKQLTDALAEAFYLRGIFLMRRLLQMPWEEELEQDPLQIYNQLLALAQDARERFAKILSLAAPKWRSCARFRIAQSYSWMLWRVRSFLEHPLLSQRLTPFQRLSLQQSLLHLHQQAHTLFRDTVRIDLDTDLAHVCAQRSLRSLHLLRESNTLLTP